MTKPWRETPLIESAALSRAAGCKVFMKLDNLQPSGSFKSRGIGNYLISHLARSKHPGELTPPSTNGTNTPVNDGDQPRTNAPAHFYCSSGGNAGLACATAAAQLHHPCTVVVPESTKQLMIDKIRAVGESDVIVHGASWQEADAFLREELLSKDPGGVYVPPFDAPDIWRGNATLVEELVKQLAQLSVAARTNSGVGGPETNGDFRTPMATDETVIPEPPDAIICSVGGGGLLNGIVQGITSPSLNPSTSSSPNVPSWASTPVIGTETLGADSMASSVAAGELITLPAIKSAATSLGARRVCQQTFDYATDPSLNIKSVVLTDDEAARACVRFANEERMMVELSCGVSIALCYDEKRRLETILRSLGRWRGEDTKVILEICGGSVVTVEMLETWRRAM
ncbi:tryptophan synthase beta subunit-like PLP-dependent enzyme [Rhizodiscina lignyota]|uniref:L-serine ammonia-lyase n=1 Tax=Rhizodiscina lignyota TaxID=1504668 RepID=A0A9P4IH66_9PEZI|nr:tryptophan synthase beta subunit-like PLP-dependent enzyme [Rhizodiscina lignyota]